MNHHVLVHCTSYKFITYTTSHVSSSSVKLNVVAATGVDVEGCYGDEEAKDMFTCMPTSFVTGGPGHMLTTTRLPNNITF